MSQIKFALSRGLAVSGWFSGVVTRGGALPEGLHGGHKRLPRAIIVRPFRAFSLLLCRQLGQIDGFFAVFSGMRMVLECLGTKR